jgi:hypothetical protein
MIETIDLKSMARETAELALELAALPVDRLRDDAHALDEIEQLATRILKEASTVRAQAFQSVGETRGMWRVMQPVRH